MDPYEKQAFDLMMSLGFKKENITYEVVHQPETPKDLENE